MSIDSSCPGGLSADPRNPVDAELSIHTLKLGTTEDLREATRGADLRIVQLAPGAFEGELTHAQIGDLALSAGDFGPDIRARGVMNPHLVTIGMMLESSGEVSQWDYDVLPGDVVVFPKSVEQEGHFTGRSRYVTITLGEDELAAHVSNEGKLQDLEFWSRIYRFRPPEKRRSSNRLELVSKVAQLRDGKLPRSAAGADYLRRSILEAFVDGIIHEMPDAGDERHYRRAKLVRDVEDYVDAFVTDRPVHLSELCSALLVSRRAMHRAFQNTMGVGPIAYLRLRRLSAVHSALQTGKLPRGSVTQAALEYGFTDLGRFAAYYRRIFEESPSETRAKGMLQSSANGI